MGRGTIQTERSVSLQPGTPEYAAEVERQRLKQAQSEEAFLAQTRGAAQQRSAPLQQGTPEYAAEVDRQQLKQADIDRAFSAYQQRSTPLQQGTPEYAEAIARQQLKQAKSEHDLSAQMRRAARATQTLPSGIRATPLQQGTPEYAAQIEQQRLKQGEMDRAFSAQINAAQQQAGGGGNRPGYQMLGGEEDDEDGILSGLPGLDDIIPSLIDYGIGKATETSAKDVGQDYGKAYAESYEEIMEAHRDEAEAMMQKDIDLQRQFTPQEQRLAWETAQGTTGIKDYKPGFIPGVVDYAGLGGEVDAVTRGLAAGTDQDIMRQQGPYMAESTMDQLFITDQPWLQTRDTGAQKVQDLLGSINMGGLSGGERAEIERMNARRNLQRGQAGGGGNLTAIENAMQFGSALDRKRAALGQALQTATNFMAGSRSGYDPVQAVLGRGSGTNQISAGFQGVQPVKDYSGQMSGLPSNIMAGVNTGGNIFDTMARGAKSRTDWLNPGGKG